MSIIEEVVSSTDSENLIVICEESSNYFLPNEIWHNIFLMVTKFSMNLMGEMLEFFSNFEREGDSYTYDRSNLEDCHPCG